MEIKVMMEYLEKNSLNNRHYFVIPNLYNKEEKWEIYLYKNKRVNEKTKWAIQKLCKPYTEPSTFVEGDYILDFIKANRIDITAFEASILSSVTTQIGYVDLLQKQAVKTFGEDFVKDCVEATDKFSADLISTINSLINKSKLKVIK